MWRFQLDHVTSFLFSQVWKLGWSPKPGGDFGTVFPEIPVEFLQEKEVFKEFIYRINTLGSPRSSLGVGHVPPRRQQALLFLVHEGCGLSDAHPVVHFAACSEPLQREVRSQFTCVRV